MNKSALEYNHSNERVRFDFDCLVGRPELKYWSLMFRIKAAYEQGTSVSRHLRGRLTLASGALSFTGQERFDEALEPGLKLVVILTGQTAIRIGPNPILRLAGPSILCLLTEAETPREQSFVPDSTYRYALVQIDPEIVRQEWGLEPRRLFEMSPAGVGVAVRPADKTVQAVASQILASLHDPSQALYRLAKGLELTALALEALRPQPRSGVSGRLSAEDVARVQAAEERLVGAMFRMPDIAALAAEVGLNGRKLTLGFRVLFGATPYAYLQERRLQTAHRLLSSGEKSVGESAHAVGYNPSHFATLFSRRFGVPPSSLVPRAALTGRSPVLNPPKLSPTK